jgi:glycogen debranching enzyme
MHSTIPPPIEPKLAYPEPLLVSVDLLSLIRGTTFFAGTRGGDLAPTGAPHIGLFRNDTRFLSRYELLINQQEPVVLSSTTVGPDCSRIELTVRGGSVPGENLDLPINTVYVHREQFLDTDHLYDVIEIQNFHHAHATLSVELAFAADFMDIFQVRGLLRGKSGLYFEPGVNNSTVSFRYFGLDERTRVTKLSFAPQPNTLKGDRAIWHSSLAPHTVVRLTAIIAMAVNEKPEAELQINSSSIDELRVSASRRYSDWRKSCTEFHSDNEIFDLLLRTSTDDFFALRIGESAGTSIAAGVPWFAALFGRDSLLSAYEALILDPELARGTLRVLASYQGQERNDERDEDPGKILHERRSGEMTATNEIAFGRSYGSVDATPLFLVLAEEYFRWTADVSLLHELSAALVAATKWILEHGDLDGDGLIEYCRRTPKGLFNQGWKDSGDAYRHSDGEVAQPPIALIEVQGYAVRALSSASKLLAFLQETELAEKAVSRSDEIRELIEKRFWLEDRAYFAMALDGRKVPVCAEGSNPGHLLFSRAVTRERARQIAARLLGDGLFSGWGIRTLSSEESYFNPMSYHCGSVWPHDNAVIGFGMARYGLNRESALIFQALYDAALHFRDYRLPELFCGVSRLAKGEPVHYPVSCSPQAWAAGSPFLLLTGLLGLCPSADCGRLAIVDPHLPQFLKTLRLDNLRIGPTRLSLEFERQGDRTYCNVADMQGEGIEVSIVFAAGNSKHGNLIGRL